MMKDMMKWMISLRANLLTSLPFKGERTTTKSKWKVFFRTFGTHSRYQEDEKKQARNTVSALIMVIRVSFEHQSATGLQSPMLSESILADKVTGWSMYGHMDMVSANRALVFVICDFFFFNGFPLMLDRRSLALFCFFFGKISALFTTSTSYRSASSSSSRGPA